MTARANGFTLVEVVVALFIFAMLATAGVSLLSFTVKAQSATARVLSDVSDERRLSALLINDLGQAVPRLSPEERGGPRPPSQTTHSDLHLSSARVSATPQPALLRLDKGTLVRMATPFVDGATVGKALVLETGVERTKLRFRNKSDWQDDWSSERTDAIPRALELTLVRKGAAPINRRILVGPGE